LHSDERPRLASQPRRRLEREQVAGRAEARDRAFRGHAHLALVAEGLARVRVREVDLDDRRRDRLDRIVKRDAGMGEGA